MSIQTMTGGQILSGSALDNTQTDTVYVESTGNVFGSIGGNLTLTAPIGGDSDTTVLPAGDGVTDNITVDGQNNVLFNAPGSGLVPLTNATVSYTVNGGTGDNLVELSNGGGGGSTTITLGGTDNEVLLNGDADNTVTSVGSGTLIEVGSFHDKMSAFSTTATIGGADSLVEGGDENFTILGTAVTSAALVELGDGNNIVALKGTGSDLIEVGDGGNSVKATGDNNDVFVGNGTNSVTLSGNGNFVNVTDPSSSKGSDAIQLGLGTGDTVDLDHAGGTVNGSGTGTTTVNQAGTQAEKVTLGNGTGLITLGNGNDTVVANGATTSVAAGNGNDSVTAGGNNDVITLGNGKNTVTAAGNTDHITLGNGNNTVTAAGSGDTGILGSGSNTVTAAGSGGTFTFNASATSVNTLTFGANDKATVNGGTLGATLNGAGDTLVLNNVKAGSTVLAGANSDTFDVNGSTSANFTLGGHATGDAFVFSAGFTGKDTISNFGGTDTLDLSNLTDAGGWQFSAHSAALDFGHLAFDLLTGGGGPTSETLKLANNASISLATGTALASSNLIF